jgi:hypothetical protein
MESTEEKVEVRKYETPDLGLAAYLKMRGMKLHSVGKDKYKYSFIFEDPNNEAEKIKLEYPDSESCKFDGEVRVMKLMIKSDRMKIKK